MEGKGIRSANIGVHYADDNSIDDSDPENARLCTEHCPFPECVLILGHRKLAKMLRKRGWPKLAKLLTGEKSANHKDN